MSTPSLWHSDGTKYNDQILIRDGKCFTILYDYPKKMTDRNHLVTKGALYFMKHKFKDGFKWVFMGVVVEVIAKGVYPDTGCKFAALRVKKFYNEEKFSNKNEAIAFWGFRPVGDNERTHGLIPLFSN